MKDEPPRLITPYTFDFVLPKSVSATIFYYNKENNILIIFFTVNGIFYYNLAKVYIEYNTHARLSKKRSVFALNGKKG